MGSMEKMKPGSPAEGRNTYRIAEKGGEADSFADSWSWDSKGTALALVVRVSGKSLSASSCSFHIYKMWIITASQGSGELMFMSRLEIP